MTANLHSETQTNPHAAQLEKGFPRLRFEPGLELEFLQDYWTHHRLRVRAGLIIGVVIFVLFSIKDIFIYPKDVWIWTVSTRCGFIVPVLLLGLIPTFSTQFKPSLAWMSWIVLGLVWAGYVIVLLEARALATPLPYESMLLMIAFVFFSTGLRALPSLISSLPAVAVYLVGTSMLGADRSTVSNQAFHLISMILIGSIGAYSRELMLRKLFLTQSLAHFRADHDPLTQLLNRGAAMRRIETAWRQAVRQHEHIAIFLIDADHFKAYNDNYGHIEGDRCLQIIAKAMQESLNRPMDVAARFGGEEFVALAYNTDITGATAIAEKIRVTIEGTKIMLENGGFARTTVSIGIICFRPVSGPTAATLTACLRKADVALYAAKSAGRNRFFVNTDEAIA